MTLVVLEALETVVLEALETHDHDGQAGRDHGDMARLRAESPSSGGLAMRAVLSI